MVGQPAPLRRFLVARKQNNVNATVTPTTENVELGSSGIQQDSTCGSDDCSKRRNSRSQRFGAAYATHAATKPRRRKRSRKGRTHLTNSKRDANHKVPRLDGHCECGVKTEAPYFERCEDCFAEDAERWNGKDQSAIIYW